MSEPLIARRCPWCGVAIRERAFFCPQCGKDLTQQQPDFGATIAESAPPEIIKKDTSELVDPGPPKESPAKAAPAEAMPAKSRKPATGQQTLGKMGAGIQKASHVARDVEENVAHRMQRLRDVSIVVIDEASYDASLRFVLVAVALFIMFLVILLLSKLIT
jgi:hypothetical protein